MKKAFTYEEERLSARLGVGREILREFRAFSLRENEDWGRQGRRVAYTEGAVRAALDHLGLKLPEKRAQKKGGATLAMVLEACCMEGTKAAPGMAVRYRPQDQMLRVAQLTRNRQIVMAAFDDEEALRPKGERYQGMGGLLRVRVRDAGKFTPGMRMRCRHVNRDLWELVGRCPRFKGRW